MLYKFQCKKSADVLMLGDLTQKIFDIIDRPLEAKGVFLVEQLEDAIKKLEEAITLDEKVRAAAQASENKNVHEEKPPTYRLGQRVFPFMQLLKDALAHQEMIIWGV
ncbi:DUF1840 domain-containing protein [Polynucleobacter sp. MWH-Spelu-300-X4]|jgi:3-deoxy-D-manno-octulosonic-acid transferase|nr:DUF1840 domain-containing protein [Polynucleobacter sp. MWH-Spelu-300-X4]